MKFPVHQALLQKCNSKSAHHAWYKSEVRSSKKFFSVTPVQELYEWVKVGASSVSDWRTVLKRNLWKIPRQKQNEHLDAIVMIHQMPKLVF